MLECWYLEQFAGSGVGCSTPPVPAGVMGTNVWIAVRRSQDFVVLLMMRLLVMTGDWTCSPRKAISVLFLVLPVLISLRRYQRKSSSIP